MIIRLSILLMVVCTAAMAAPQDTEAIDREKALAVEAGYLLNFTKFVKWPDDKFDADSAPIVIAVCGEDPFGSILDRTVEGAVVRGRPIRVRRISTAEELIDKPSRLAGVHMMYICPSERKHVKTLARLAHERNVLTVSSLNRFAHEGGLIGLTLEGDHIVFEINYDVLRRTDLKVSAKLLKLSRIVRSDEAEE